MTASDQLFVAVIIVNYNTADLVTAHLDAALKALAGFKAAHVFIVDNASPEGDLEKLRAHVAGEGLAGRVTVTDTGGNPGFAGGNNTAFPLVRDFGADYVFFLNPDARPEPSAIEALAALLEAHPDAAIAGPQILDERGEKYASEFAFPTILREFAAEAGIKALQTMTGQFRDHQAGRTTPVETDWVSGAAFMARMSAIGDTPMDDGFFLYYEETDMMLTLKREGWSVWHEPAARVTHIGGAATGVSGAANRRLPAHWFASWRHYYRKNHGAFYAFLAGVAKTLGLFVYHAKRMVKRERSQKPAQYTQDVLQQCLLRVFNKG